jgi:hypothetical protein
MRNCRMTGAILMTSGRVPMTHAHRERLRWILIDSTSVRFWLCRRRIFDLRLITSIERDQFNAASYLELPTFAVIGQSPAIVRT